MYELNYFLKIAIFFFFFDFYHFSNFFLIFTLILKIAKNGPKNNQRASATFFRQRTKS